jgi:hypothetical protein
MTFTGIIQLFWEIGLLIGMGILFGGFIEECAAEAQRKTKNLFYSVGNAAECWGLIMLIGSTILYMIVYFIILMFKWFH